MKLLEAAGPSCPNCGSSDIKVLDSGADPYKDGGGGEGSTSYTACECNNCGTTYTFVSTSYYTDVEVGAGLDDTIYGIFRRWTTDDDTLPFTANDFVYIESLVGEPDPASENIRKNLYRYGANTFDELSEALSKIKVSADHYYNEVNVSVAGATLPNGPYVCAPWLKGDNLTDEERIKALEYLKSPKAAKAYFKTKQDAEKFISLYDNFTSTNEKYNANSNSIDYTHAEDLRVLPFTLNEMYDKVMHDYEYK